MPITKNRKISYYLIIVAVLLAGISLSIWTGFHLRQQAIEKWLSDSRSEHNRISTTLLNWLEQEQGPIRSLSTLFYNTNTPQFSSIDESLFSDSISFLEFTESSVHDLSLAFGEDNANNDVVITLSTIKRYPLEKGVIISNNEDIQHAIKEAFDSTSKIIMSPIFSLQDGDFYTVFTFLVPNGPNKNGYLFNLVNLSNLFKELESLYIDDGIRLRIAVETANNQQQFIFGSRVASDDTVTTNLIRAISMDKKWFFYWDTLKNFQGGADTSEATILSIAANLITVIAALFIWNLFRRNQIISQKVIDRTRELENAYCQLKDTQNHLIQSEKMASLGSLVAGIAHELNTPLGNAVTIASNIDEQTQSLAKLMSENKLTRSLFDEYVQTMHESSLLMLKNTKKAGELIRNFKQVAVDQTSEQRRRFNCIQVTQELVSTLSPLFKHTLHTIKVTGDEIEIDSYPGAFGQIITNMISNSLFHAFEHVKQGVIEINFSLLDQQYLKICIHDNGCGIPEANLSKIFDPFFTTKFGKGGSGLGLNIVYNIVTTVLKGRIQVENQQVGVLFTIVIPVSVHE